MFRELQESPRGFQEKLKAYENAQKEREEASVKQISEQQKKRDDEFKEWVKKELLQGKE